MMAASSWVSLLGGMLLATAPADDGGSAPPTARSPAGAPAAGKSVVTPTEAQNKGPTSVESLKLPADAVVVIVREIRRGLGMVPDGVVLSAATWQEFRTRLERLERLDKERRQKAAARPQAPAVCTISGRVEADVARFQLQFQFVTDQAGASVALGCLPRAYPRAARLDGRLPTLSQNEDGLVVRVDRPGEHELALDVEVQVSSSGKAQDNERGLEFVLPRAAITILKRLTLPPEVAALQINGRPRPTLADDAGGRRVEDVALGPTGRLELTWKGPPVQRNEPPVLAANARIVVHLNAAQVATDADLELRVLAGQVQEWRIQVPPETRAEVEDERVKEVRLPAADAKDPVLVIRLTEPSSRPLTVKLHVRKGRSADWARVGPFFVPGALRQQGTVSIAVAPDLRLKYQAHGDITQQAPGEEKAGDNIAAALSYWNPPPPPQSLLDVAAEPVRGVVEALVTHTLRLAPGTGWRLSTRIDVTPVRMAVDQLDVELPARLRYDSKTAVGPADLVDPDNPIEIREATPEKRVARLRLAQARPGAFSLTLQGWYGVRPGERAVSLPLPRPVAVLGRGGEARGELVDRGGEVKIEVPEGLELAATSAGPEALPTGTRTQTWASDQTPARVDLSWRPHRPDVPTTSVVDLTLGVGKAWVEQRLQLPRGSAPAVLQAPRSLADRITVEADGKVIPLIEPQAGGGEFTFGVPATARNLVVKYDFPIPALANPPGARSAPHGGRGRSFVVPLVWPRQASRGDTLVRVWSDEGGQLLPAPGAWDEQRVEPTDRPTLPALVLRSGRLHAPLSLREVDAGERPAAGVVIDRALVAVAVGEGSRQVYRARFLLSRLNTSVLALELPEPALLLEPKVYVNGKQVTQVEAAGSGRLLRVRVESDNGPRPVVLEVRYEIRGDDVPGNGLLHATLYPPRVRDSLLLGEIRWQVALPAGQLPVYQGSTQGAGQTWERRGGLLAPRSAVTDDDLDGWLLGSPTAARRPATPGAERPSLVCRQMSFDPLAVVYVAEPAWLLLCSLLFVAAGLCAVFAPLPRAVPAVGVLAVGLVVAATSVWWPATLPALLYGCEPGAIALLLILVVQWMLHQRYRRQVLFLPGFTRVKAGSSLIGSSGHRPHGEPSTIDAPPPVGSGVKEMGT
jgi:hypothetical protein